MVPVKKDARLLPACRNLVERALLSRSSALPQDIIRELIALPKQEIIGWR
jgi:hypothetical protein